MCQCINIADLHPCVFWLSIVYVYLVKVDRFFVVLIACFLPDKITV